MTSLDFPEVSRPPARIEHTDPDLALAEMWEPAFTDSASLALSADPAAAHDPTRLPAALQEIEARRAAIEWLLEADLLRLCLV